MIRSNIWFETHLFIFWWIQTSQLQSDREIYFLSHSQLLKETFEAIWAHFYYKINLAIFVFVSTLTEMRPF